jgi:ribosome modulation factor
LPDPGTGVKYGFSSSTGSSAWVSRGYQRDVKGKSRGYQREIKVSINVVSTKGYQRGIIGVSKGSKGYQRGIKG